MPKCHGYGCANLPVKNRNYCDSHLLEARKFWKKRVEARLASGQCINCERPHLPDQQRCAACREKNRRKSGRWGRENYKARYKRLKREIATTKRCSWCPEHRKITDPNSIRCESCKLLKRFYNLFRRTAGFTR
jgi:hypothetical protein